MTGREGGEGKGKGGGGDKNRPPGSDNKLLACEYCFKH